MSGKFLARLHDDGVSLVLKVDPDARDILLQAQPETFYITDHYAGSPAYILVRIAAAHPSELARMFEEAWRNAASRRLIATRDGAR